MSCVAAIRFSTIIAIINATTVSVPGAIASTPSVSAAASCIARIHVRRRPRRGNHRRSTTGAQMNFSAHGNASSDVRPISSSE
jgi:hypothetical protein